MKYTREMRDMILETLRKTPIVETTCQKTGISKMTFSRWRRQNPKFNAQVEEALLEGRSRMNDVAENIILAGLAADDVPSAKFFLTHNNPRYANKLELSGMLETKDESLTKEEKALLREAFKRSSLYGKNKQKREK